MNNKPALSGSKTRQQIANEFSFSYPTFWRKIKSVGIDLPSGLICPKWQKLIYEALGYPPEVESLDKSGDEA
ncbi:MAG: hypothetical protein GC192_20925 [Bacteroidetes bacterium]|nr:hypothetical protein [Bacteroidota bacterium]